MRTTQHKSFTSSSLCSRFYLDVGRGVKYLLPFSRYNGEGNRFAGGVCLQVLLLTDMTRWPHLAAQALTQIFKGVSKPLKPWKSFVMMSRNVYIERALSRYILNTGHERTIHNVDRGKEGWIWKHEDKGIKQNLGNVNVSVVRVILSPLFLFSSWLAQLSTGGVEVFTTQLVPWSLFSQEAKDDSEMTLPDRKRGKKRERGEQ